MSRLNVYVHMEEMLIEGPQADTLPKTSVGILHGTKPMPICKLGDLMLGV
jgi:hypothetical protein